MNASTRSGSQFDSSRRREDPASCLEPGDSGFVGAEHPRIGGLILALSDDPQSTTAWETGARGEEVLAQRLDRLSGKGVRCLHDRRIPGSRANIDHLAIAPSGVFVIDAKRYKGRPQLRVEGGLLHPRTERLVVGSRDCTKAVAGVHKQLGLVRAALDHSGDRSVPLAGVLCFVEADWPLIGGSFAVEGVHVLWPRKAAELILKPGALAEDQLHELHRRLATALPSA